MGRVRTFRELEVYRNAFALAMEVFRLASRFPAHERFGLSSQALRSSRSVCANTAEAWRRRRYPAAFVARLTDAEAEAAETRVHLDFARACGYLDAATHHSLDRRYDRLIGQIVRMIHSADSWTVGRPTPTSPTSEKTKRPPKHRQRRSSRHDPHVDGGPR